MFDTFGNLTVSDNWFVTQKFPSIFSRIYLVLGGNASYKDESTTQKFKNRHLCCMPNLKLYECVHEIKNPLNVIYFHLDIMPGVIEKFTQLDIEKDAFLKSLFDTISISYKEKNKEELSVLMEQLGKVLAIHLRQIGVIESFSREVSTAIEYISKNYTRKLSVEELSNTCGYSKEYFTNLFKKNVGISPHQYIIAHRMRVAVKLLQQGVSVKQISAKLAYDEAKNFSRAFKSYYGVTPRNFRLIMP